MKKKGRRRCHVCRRRFTTQERCIICRLRQATADLLAAQQEKA